MVLLQADVGVGEHLVDLTAVPFPLLQKFRPTPTHPLLLPTGPAPLACLLLLEGNHFLLLLAVLRRRREMGGGCFFNVFEDFFEALSIFQVGLSFAFPYFGRKFLQVSLQSRICFVQVVMGVGLIEFEESLQQGFFLLFQERERLDAPEGCFLGSFFGEDKLFHFVQA